MSKIESGRQAEAAVVDWMRARGMKIVGTNVRIGRLELDIIAAVVIGGASLSGGSGSILGSMIGALIIQTLRNGSSLMNWPTFTQEIIIGIVIILAVGLDRYRQSRMKA